MYYSSIKHSSSYKNFTCLGVKGPFHYLRISRETNSGPFHYLRISRETNSGPFHYLRISRETNSDHRTWSLFISAVNG